MIRKRLPSPAMVIAVLALFVALGGTAVAAGVVPLAKRALVADNAKKLGGLTPAALVAGIPGLVTVRTQPWSLGAAGGNDFSVGCNAGEKAIGGGYDNPNGDALSIDNRPSSDASSWKIYLLNISTSQSASGTLYAVCLA
jgi:hypothetical protein